MGEGKGGEGPTAGLGKCRASPSRLSKTGAANLFYVPPLGPVLQVGAGETDPRSLPLSARSRPPLACPRPRLPPAMASIMRIVGPGPQSNKAASDSDGGAGHASLHAPHRARHHKTTGELPQTQVMAPRASRELRLCHAAGSSASGWRICKRTRDIRTTAPFVEGACLHLPARGSPQHDGKDFRSQFLQAQHKCDGAGAHMLFHGQEHCPSQGEPVAHGPAWSLVIRLPRNVMLAIGVSQMVPMRLRLLGKLSHNARLSPMMARLLLAIALRSMDILC